MPSTRVEVNIIKAYNSKKNEKFHFIATDNTKTHKHTDRKNKEMLHKKKSNMFRTEKSFDEV